MNLKIVISAAAVTAAAGALSVGAVGPAAAQDRGRDRDSRSDRRTGDRDDRRTSDRDDHRRGRDDDHVRFTHSEEGRRFDRGIELRRGTVVRDRHVDYFFPHHYVSYPHYVYSRPSVSIGIDIVASPFHFFFGTFPPYIERRHVILAPPPRVYIEVPIYVGNTYRGYGDGRGDYYLNRRADDDRWRDDPEVRRAVYDLEDAFRNEDITLLANLTDPGTKIAIFARGHYDYSLEPNDYLDMTRDFLRGSHTTGYETYRVHRRSAGVYQVFSKHSYRDPDGKTRLVYICTVIERIGGRWSITQIDTSPDRLDG